MGNTCKPMAVSFQCMTKFTTNKKKLKKKESQFLAHVLQFTSLHNSLLSLDTKFNEQKHFFPYTYLTSLIYPTTTDICICDSQSYQGKLIKWRWPGRQNEKDIPERGTTIVRGRYVKITFMANEAKESKKRNLKTMLGRKSQDSLRRALFVILMRWEAMRAIKNV